MRNKLLFTLLFLVIGTSISWSQLAMTRSTFTGVYTPITTVGGATTSTAVGDDANQSGIPLGFTFNYLGTNFTTIDVCTNGWASFSSGGSTSLTSTGLYTTTTPNNTLAPWWDDMATGTGSILYQTQGTPGSQTFTLQWTDISSYFTGSTQTINFQVILYEGTNVIEFQYGIVAAGTPSASESAAIGIENATGGNGNYLDAITGSPFTSNSTMSTTTKWPVRHIRLTPGAPSVLAGGTYMVGAGQTYPTLDEAVADVNHRGISGPVTLELTDALYDVTPSGGDNIFPILVGPVTGASAINTLTIQPTSGTSTLSYEGSLAGNCGNAASSTLLSTTTEPLLGIVGGRFININNLNLTCSATGVVDKGLDVINSSGTFGSQNNVFQNINVQLNRATTSSIGIEQRTATTATSAAGANSNNIYRNLNVQNAYVGIHLSGTAAFPDLNCIIGNTSPTAFNTIGGVTPNDIGNGTTATYGIRLTSQSAVMCSNNEIQNVGVTNTGTVDGIFLELSQGTSHVFNNKIHDLRNLGTTSTANITGIRANVATTAGHNARVYNNFVYSLSSGYTGAASATRQVKGIWAQSAGGGAATSSINVDFNNVRIDGSSNLNISNTCFQIGTVTGPVMNVRNNVFANVTAAQISPAVHYAWSSTDVALTGNTGSISNYNDLYVADTTQGHVGLGNTTPYHTLANWQTATTQDANSLTVDPFFVSSTDLHVYSVLLDAVGNMAGITWVTNDIDNEVRGGTPDIGADEFVTYPSDIGVSLLVAPVSGNCFSASTPVTVRVINYGSTPYDFSANNAMVTVDVTGAIVTSLNVNIIDNSLNAGLPLGVGAGMDVPVGTLDMSAVGTYTFNSYTTAVADMNVANDDMPPADVTIDAGTASPASQDICNYSSINLTISGLSSGFTIQWQSSTDGGFSWVNETGPGFDTTVYNVSPTDTTIYRVLSCGLYISTYDTINVIHVADPVANDTTRCGAGPISLIANGVGNMNWYDMPVGGSLIYQGDTLTTSVSTDTTFYVAASSGGGGSAILGLPSQISTFSGNVRGMWFTAPTSFTITGLQAPGTGLQNITVIRFNPAVAPPTFPTTTNAFDVLYLTQNDPSTGVISVNIPIASGEIIGIMSQRGNVTSYGPTGPYNTTIDGFPVTLTRLGMQFPLATNPPQSIWTEPGGNLGRTEITYSVGCESNRIPVDVTVVPAIPISLNFTDSTICDVDTIVLDVTSTNTSYSYSWTPSTSLSDSVGTPVMAWPLNDISYVVTGIDTASCMITDTVNFVVNPAPTAAMVVNPTVTCYGDPVTLTASGNSGGGTYSMTGPDVVVPDSDPLGVRDTIAVSGAQGSLLSGDLVSVCINITHTWDSDLDIFLVSPAGTQIELSTDNGGSLDHYLGTCFDMTAVTPITAGAAPFIGSFIPEGTFDAFTGENANGDWQLWVVDDLGGDTGSVHDWSITFNSFGHPITWSSIPAGLSDTALVTGDNPIVTTTYVLTVTDTTNGCSRNYSDTVIVNPLPVVMLGPDTAICSNYAGIILDGTNAGAGTYQWQDGQNGPTYFASLPGTYSVEVTDTNGCIGSDTISVGTITAQVVSIDANLTGIHDADLDAGAGFISYNWSTAATSQVINVNTNGTYYVTCIDANGCESTDTLTIVFSLGVFNSNGTETTLQLYPNPSDGVFSLGINNLETSDLVIEVLDMQGKVVHNRVVGEVTGSTIQPFSLTNLRAGAYNLRVIANGKTSTLRFIIK